ncbi:MAG: polymer-forming cytoskeletal protein [Rhodospirillales bacterium]|nr:polymer-forming cytoskeletal protein [Rhodospirillales bacterium]
MFSKNKNGSTTSRTQVPQQKPSVPSIISADLTVTGDLVSDGELQIDGAINGDIKTDTLLIGESAHIKGEVHAKHVRVHGRVDGQISAQSVILAKTAHVCGDVIHEDLSIEKGAFLEGHCMRMSDTKSAVETSTIAKVGLDKDMSQQNPVDTDKDKPGSSLGSVVKTATA